MLRRHQQPMPPTRLRPGSYWQPTPIVEAWPFASITSAQTLPLVIGYSSANRRAATCAEPRSVSAHSGSLFFTAST